ncbi:MAG TPA: histidine kinase [Sphingobacteriaceae bacterium]
MTTNDFIFSKERSHRLTRHFVFWAVYTLYFFPQSIWYPDSLDQLLNARVYRDALMNFACFIPACVLSVYISIYVLLPAFLQRKRYMAFALSYVLLFLITIPVNYLFSRLYYVLVSDPEANTTFMGLLNLGYINSVAAIIISGIALGIKSTKNLQQQQKENLSIAKKKARTDLQLQKSRIHPQFLFRTLNSIHARIHAASGDASEMVLRLSDLLSYTLYAGKDKLVPVEQELAALQDFIFLEQRKNENGEYLSVHVSLDRNRKYIVPMVTLSMIDDSIRAMSDTGPVSGVLTTHVSTRNVWLRLNISLRMPEHSMTESIAAKIFERCQVRMAAAYSPASYRITSKTGDGDISVHLQLRLNDSIQPNRRDLKRKAHEPA